MRWTFMYELEEDYQIHSNILKLVMLIFEKLILRFRMNTYILKKFMLKLNFEF